MMQRTLVTRLIFIAGFAMSVMANNALARVNVDYVRICSLFGAGFYYLPGSDRCLAPVTGKVRYVDSNGKVIFTQTQLSYRITLLEQRLAKLKAKYQQKLAERNNRTNQS